MAISIKSLNSGASFLLTCAPSITPSTIHRPECFPGAFTILIDPNLVTESDHQRAQAGGLGRVADIQEDNLNDLPEIDVILISRDSMDCCHKPTLRAIRSRKGSLVVAPSRVVKKLRSWKYFEDSVLQTILPLRPTGSENPIITLEVPAFSPGTSAGEVTLTLMEQKKSFRQTYSAIGITYRPPATVLNYKTHRYLDLSDQSSPTSSIEAPNPSLADVDVKDWSPQAQNIQQYALSSHATNISTQQDCTGCHGSNPSATAVKRSLDLTTATRQIPNPTPISPTASSTQPTVRFRASTSSSAASSSISNTHTRMKSKSSPGERTISLLYAPEGCPLDPLYTWASTHLLMKSALPLTMLIHGVGEPKTASTSWWCGGGGADGAGEGYTGFESGSDIAKGLLAGVWIIPGCAASSSGARTAVSPGREKRRDFEVAEAQRLMRPEGPNDVHAGSSAAGMGRPTCEVLRLRIGEEKRVGYKMVSEKEAKRARKRENERQRIKMQEGHPSERDSGHG